LALGRSSYHEELVRHPIRDCRLDGGAIPRRGQPPSGAATARPTVFQLMYVDAAKAAKKLRALLGEGNVTVSFDEELNALFIQASPEKLQQAETILHRLDVGWATYLTVIRLQHVNAAQVATPLLAILQLSAWLRGEECGMIVNTFEDMNAVTISGTSNTMQQAEEFLHSLDAQGTTCPESR
jgi:type II secretory pathway component GspD/PulD (secretin)